MSSAFVRRRDRVTLEAVYNVNKHAKKYGRLADENYQAGKKASARANSLKKALYGVKSRAINRFLLDGDGTVASVERHLINGDPFLCLRFEMDGETWSFHQPEDEARLERIEVLLQAEGFDVQIDVRPDPADRITSIFEKMRGD